MSDFYNIDSVNQKQKPKQQDDSSIVQEAERIEQQNYDEAHRIKKQLSEAHLNQKEATTEMKRQTETLGHTRKSAHGVHQEAQKGEDLADDIDREGRIFSCRFACIDKIFKWFRKTEDKQTEVKDEEVPQAKHKEFQETDEFVPGQNKTDKELVGVLNTVRNIRQQAEVQSNEAQKQKTVIGDIGRTNEESEKVIKRTDEHLKKLD